MRHVIVVCLGLVIGVTGAYADARGDCGRLSGDAAIRACDRAIRQNPKDAWSYLYRGSHYDGKHEYDRAVVDYSRAIEINPLLVQAYINRGGAYFGKKDYDRAIADYSRAIEIDPRHPYTHVNRARIYYEKKDYDRAIADYSKSLETNPEEGRLLGYSGRGRAYYAKGDYDRAIADYSKLIETNPNPSPTGWFNYEDRGNAYYAKADYDRAVADYSKVIEVHPKHPARRTLGYARFYKGDFKEAAIDLLRVLELQDDPYVMLFRFLARARAGENAGPELEANAGRLKDKAWPFAANRVACRQAGARGDVAGCDQTRGGVRGPLLHWRVVPSSWRGDAGGRRTQDCGRNVSEGLHRIRGGGSRVEAAWPLKICRLGSPRPWTKFVGSAGHSCGDCEQARGVLTLRVEIAHSGRVSPYRPECPISAQKTIRH